MGLEERVERHLGRLQGRRRVRDDDLGHLVVTARHGGVERGRQGPRHQHSLGARVFQHVGIVVCGQQGVHAHGHQSGIHGAQVAHGPVGAVMHQHQHALLTTQAQGPQPRGQAAHTVIEFAIADGAVVIDEGGFAGAFTVHCQQVLGHVETFTGRGDGRRKAHEMSPVAARADRSCHGNSSKRHREAGVFGILWKDLNSLRI